MRHLINATIGARMRTTLDIDDDLLTAAKELARRERVSAGKVVSRLLRHSPTGRARGAEGQSQPRKAITGFKPFAARPDSVTTNDQVDALRAAEGL